MGSRGQFNGVIYYGRLITHEEARNIEDRDGNYPISTNGLQGSSGKKLVEDLLDMPGLKVLMDYDEDTERIDTIIIWDINYAVTQGCNVAKLIEIIGHSHPDECDEYENDTIRLWWD